MAALAPPASITGVARCSLIPHLTIGNGGQTRLGSSRKQFNASDFLNYWCGPLFSLFFQASFRSGLRVCPEVQPRFPLPTAGA